MSAETRPSLFEIGEGVATMVAGLTAALMPLFLLSMPALAPLAVFTGVVLAVLGLAGAVLLAVVGAPLLLGRALVRRLRGARGAERRAASQRPGAYSPPTTAEC